MSEKIVSDPFDQQTELSTGQFSGNEWRRVVCSVVDSNGDKVSPANGTLEMAVQIDGADEWLEAPVTLALFDGDRWFDPFYDAVQKFRFTPVNLDAGAFVIVTVHQWNE